ncbi:porin family protein [Mucilaginibacter sp. dw_454]|uniref:porin family protein n=1 Tax=Mucilaginibacter sp. dw_454 TaxID=2720079 RepID=UPI001BD390BC|nr:porin family protein [Mucilaginibacter sp. dw_454]
MKKLFTTLFIVAGIYTASTAQTKGQTAFGVGFGVNDSYASVSADYSSGTSSRLDYNASLQAEYYVSDNFSLKLKAIYDKKGFEGIYNDVANAKTVANADFTFNYVTIPLLVTYHPGTEKLWYFNAGPYVGFLLSESNSYNHQSQKGSGYTSTDYGADLGLGIQFPLSYKNQRTKFFVEYGWQVGFANLLANSDNSANMVRQALGLGIRF